MRRPTAAAVCAAWSLLALGCDPSARANDSMAAPGQGDSRELESCAATSHCAEGLRCVDRVCQPQASSVVGDYYAALGRAAMERGDVDASVDWFSRAVNQHEADDVSPPARLHCEQGHALVLGRMDPERAELGARVLHRCLLGAPPGSGVRERALADLALLDELGLDPLTLTRDEPADAYLTRARKRPSVDELTLEVQGKTRTSSRTYKRFVKLLRSDKVKAELLPCWERYWKQAHEDTLELSVPFEYRFRLTRYDDFDRALLNIPDDDAPEEAAESKAYQCFVGALAPIADEYSKKTYEATWDATITFTMGPSDA